MNAHRDQVELHREALGRLPLGHDAALVRRLLRRVRTLRREQLRRDERQHHERDDEPDHHEDRQVVGHRFRRYPTTRPEERSDCASVQRAPAIEPRSRAPPRRRNSPTTPRPNPRGNPVQVRRLLPVLHRGGDLHPVVDLQQVVARLDRRAVLARRVGLGPPRHREADPAPADQARPRPGSMTRRASRRRELGGAPVRGLRGRGPPPQEDEGPDQLVRDLLRRLHARLPRQVLGLRLQLQRPPLRGVEAVPVAPRLAGHGHQPHALLRRDVLPRDLGLEAQPGMDDRLPARVRGARAHRRERQHRHDALVPVLDLELEPPHLGVRGHGQGRQVPRRGRVLQQPRLR